MFKIRSTNVFAIIFCVLLATNALCSDVTVSNNGGTLIVNGNNAANSVEVFSDTKSIIVRGHDGTTINGQTAKYFLASGINAVHVNLKNGHDKLYVHDLTVDQVFLEHEHQSGEVYVDSCEVVNMGIIMGSGDDSVTVERCKGEFLVVGDDSIAFLTPASLNPSLSKSEIKLRDCDFICADLQAELVVVDEFNGAVRAMATKANIMNVDASSGDASLNFPIGIGLTLEPASIWLTADRDSAKTDFLIWNAVANNVEIVTTGSLLNRTNEDDYLRAYHVETGSLSIQMGKGKDVVLMSGGKVREDSVIDMGASRDGKNYGYFWNVNCEQEVEIHGGDQDDEFHIQGGIFSDRLFFVTGEGNDWAKLNKVDCDYLHAEMGRGNDYIEFEDVVFGHEMVVDGGAGFDTAKMNKSTITYEVDAFNLEDHNLTPWNN